MLSSKIIFGFDKLEPNGEPTPNCRKLTFEGWDLCESGNYFCGMFQNVSSKFLKIIKKGEFQTQTCVKFMDINDIKDKQYFYVIDTKEFAGMLGFKRFGTFVTEETVFEHIPKKVLKDCKNNQCFIVFNYGFEGFSSSWEDTLLFKPLFNKFHEKIQQYNLPQKNIFYIDGNLTFDEINLDTQINYFSYEYTALDWDRYAKMHPTLTYHRNTISKQNFNKLFDNKKILRKKYFMSQNRLPKNHRFELGLFLYRNNFLKDGFFSFPKIEDFNQFGYKFDTSITELKPYVSKFIKSLPYKIDGVNFTQKKWSYEKFDVEYYLQSYFSIICENQFTDYDDQLQFSEKVWKPITNFHPFILLGDRHQIKQLKKWGFKTFEPFIDESYDEIQDTEQRFKKASNQIKKLCKMSRSELHEWYWSIEKTLRHNYYHFYGHFIKGQRQKLINNFERVLNE